MQPNLPMSLIRSFPTNYVNKTDHNLCFHMHPYFEDESRSVWHLAVDFIYQRGGGGGFFSFSTKQFQRNPIRREMAEEKKMDLDDGGGKEEVGASSSGSAPRFEIKKWNAVTMWSWDICADTCAICRNSLNEPSIEYQVIDSFFLINCLQKCCSTRQIHHQITKMGWA